MKKAIAILMALLMALTCLSAFAADAETAGSASASVNYAALLADMLASYEAQQRIGYDTEALDDDIARAIAAHWKKVYLDPDYQLFLYGKDDPSALPVTGRHAFVVLGYELKDGEMTEELMGRCDAAAAAALAFPDSILVCSGGATGPNNPDAHTEAGLMRDYLIGHGIAAERIFTDERAMTTAENAINTFEILRAQEIETMTIVTSSYHQRWGQVLYNALAAQYRQAYGYSAEIVGNYCYDTEPADEIFLQDARIAVMQLGSILGLSEEEMALLPSPLANSKRQSIDYAQERNWAYFAVGEGKDADLFLICPTVDMNDEFNMSLDDEDTKASFLGALNMERGLYEENARMYAPYYRQASMKVYSLEAEDQERYLSRAYRDVSSAFSYYLKHENQGRPIILAGFSQGADMCYRLLEEYFGDEALYEQLVAVYAIGWPCTERLVSQYPQIKPAVAADDVGVVISFDCEAPELAETFITPIGQKAYTINPLNWMTDGTPADKSQNLGACFTRYSGEIRREEAQLCGCYIDETRGVVKVTDVAPEDYPPVVPGLPEGAYHIYDYQFFFRNLQRNVTDRLDTYLTARQLKTALPLALCEAAQADMTTAAQVSFLGPAGTYTEEAAQFFFPTGAALNPKDTVNDAIADVLAGEADYAVIPQENTLGGAVLNYVDALIAAEDAFVVGEVVLPISQTLMGLPGAALDDIQTVCSHAQGLTQSAQWRSEHLPDAEAMEMASTAAAASYVAETGDKSIAAVAAPGAASLYGLDVLAENVQMSDANKTRFYVLSLDPLEGEDLTRAVFVATCEASRIDDIILALHEAGLEPVAIHDRPEGGKLGSYRYVIEVEDEAGITDEQIDCVCAQQGVRCAGRFHAVEKGLGSEPERIPDWRADSPAMASIVAFVETVTDEASPNYVAPEARIALFDSDGTLIGERYPTYSDQCMLLQRLLHDDTSQGNPEDVAFASALEAAILNHAPLPDSPRSTAQMAAESFAGFTVEAYRAYVREFLKQPVAGFEGMTYGERFFVPMVSLVQYLKAHDFQVYICSGTERVFLRELVAEPLGAWIPPYRVIGSTFSLIATGQGDTAPRSYTYAPDDQVLLEGNMIFKNLKMNKVVSIVNEIGLPPILVFGNSSGDFAMGQYALQHGGRAYMLLCDDTERDYGDADEAAAFAEACEALGFETVSMRDEFETIYSEGVVKADAGALEPAA